MKYIWQTKQWPHFTWDSAVLLPLIGQARRAQSGLLANVKRLGIYQLKETQQIALSEEVIATSVFEREPLNRQSVRSTIARRLGLPSADFEPKESLGDNLADVLLDATQNHAAPLTIKRIHGWQATLFPNSGGECSLRDSELPPSDDISRMTNEFLNWWDTSKSTVDGLLRAAIAHFYFATIYPFEDGNGIIARAITDMALAQDEKFRLRYYSLSSQILKERNSYYQTLERSVKTESTDITEWLVWFLSCYQRAIARSAMLLDPILRKANFWQLHAQAGLSERQWEAINGVLDSGTKNSPEVLTTQKYVSFTKTSRATAIREIKALLEKNVVRQVGEIGRYVHYDLVWPQ